MKIKKILFITSSILLSACNDKTGLEERLTTVQIEHKNKIINLEENHKQKLDNLKNSQIRDLNAAKQNFNEENKRINDRLTNYKNNYQNGLNKYELTDSQASQAEKFHQYELSLYDNKFKDVEKIYTNSLESINNYFSKKEKELNSEYRESLELENNNFNEKYQDLERDVIIYNESNIKYIGLLILVLIFLLVFCKKYKQKKLLDIDKIIQRNSKTKFKLTDEDKRKLNNLNELNNKLQLELSEKQIKIDNLHKFANKNNIRINNNGEYDRRYKFGQELNEQLEVNKEQIHNINKNIENNKAKISAIINYYRAEWNAFYYSIFDMLRMEMIMKTFSYTFMIAIVIFSLLFNINPMQIYSSNNIFNGDITNGLYLSLITSILTCYFIIGYNYAKKNSLLYISNQFNLNKPDNV